MVSEKIYTVSFYIKNPFIGETLIFCIKICTCNCFEAIFCFPFSLGVLQHRHTALSVVSPRPENVNKYCIDDCS